MAGRIKVRGGVLFPGIPLSAGMKSLKNKSGYYKRWHVFITIVGQTLLFCMQPYNTLSSIFPFCRTPVRLLFPDAGREKGKNLKISFRVEISGKSTGRIHGLCCFIVYHYSQDDLPRRRGGFLAYLRMSHCHTADFFALTSQVMAQSKIY